MNTKQLAVLLAKKEKITQAQAYNLIMSFIEIVKDQIIKGQIVKLSGFFSYKIEVLPQGEFFDPFNKIKIKKDRRFTLKSTISVPFKKIIRAKKTY